jgi:ribosome-associated heat shock protein Hsp15
MPEKDNIRIDKFLWAVRIFKTRSLASEACRKGRIMINGMQAKPSRTVKKNELIIVKIPPAIFTYEVIEPVANRLPARLVPDFIRDLTPDDEKARLITRKSGGFGYRLKGSGRPTKKERRTLDRLDGDFIKK